MPWQVARTATEHAVKDLFTASLGKRIVDAMDRTPPLAAAYREAIRPQHDKPGRVRRSAIVNLAGSALLAALAILAYHLPATTIDLFGLAGVELTAAQARFVVLTVAIAAASSMIGDARDVFRPQLDPRDFRAMICISLVVNYAVAVTGVVALAFFADDLTALVGRPFAVAGTLLCIVVSLVVVIFESAVLTGYARAGAASIRDQYWVSEIALIEQEITTALDTAGVRTPGFAGLHQMAAVARAHGAEQAEK